MGTSTSSAGAGAGSPFDPPWLEDEVPEDPNAEKPPVVDSPPAVPSDTQGDADASASESVDTGTSSSGSDTAEPSAPPALAPPRRFADARRNMTSFVKSGHSDDARAATSGFVNRGLGGPQRAASRMRTTSKAAASLGSFLTAARDGTSSNVVAWVDSVRLRNLSAQDLVLEVVERLLPDGGSIDEESARNAMVDAVSELYVVEPTVDIFALTDEQISLLMAYTIAFDVCNRLDLELGRVFEKLRFDARVLQERRNQIREYVKAVAVEEMRKVKARGAPMNPSELANTALRNALNVFGEE